MGHSWGIAQLSVTGGSHTVSDGVFIGGERWKREKEKKKQTTKMNWQLRLMKIEDNANLILEAQDNHHTRWTADDLNTILSSKAK